MLGGPGVWAAKGELDKGQESRAHVGSREPWRVCEQGGERAVAKVTCRGELAVEVGRADWPWWWAQLWSCRSGGHAMGHTPRLPAACARAHLELCAGFSRSRPAGGLTPSCT